MTKNCSAYLCPNIYKRGSVITFYRFPQDLELREKWVQAMQIKDFQVTAGSILCSDHFTPDDFNRTMGAKVLTPEAVPSVFPSVPIYFTAVAKRKRPKENEEITEERENKRSKFADADEDVQVNRCDLYCRLCAEAIENGVSIFSSEDSAVSLYENVINEYLAFTVSREDQLSSKLCRICADILVKFNSMAVKSILAQHKLKKIGGLVKEAETQVASDCEEESQTIFEVEDDFAANFVGEIMSETGPNSDMEVVAEINTEVEENRCEESAPIASEPEEEVDDSAVFNIDEFLKKKKTIKKKKPEKRVKYQLKSLRKRLKASRKKDERRASDAVPPSWQDVLSCSVCNRVGTKPYPELKVKCVICNDEQPNLFLHYQHLKTEHKNKEADEKSGFQHHCSHCEEGFALRSLALKHEKVCVKNDPYVCEICEKRFSSAMATEAHYRSHKPVDCKACNMQFFIPSLFRKHVRLEHKAEHICVDCGRKYSSEIALHYHRQKHTGIMDFVCPFCGVGCGSVVRFSIHLVMHTQERPYNCSYCGKSFQHPRYIYIHEREVHAKGKNRTCREYCKCASCVKEKSFKCEHCPKACRKLSTLKLHLFSCRGLNGNVKQVSQQKRRTGPRYRPIPEFECEICGKRFSIPRTWEIHQKMHKFEDKLGEKRYGCADCGRRFFTYHGLYNHSRTAHYPEFCKNRCKQCGKAFPVASGLAAHMNSKHGEEKTFDCEPCGKSFRIQASLTRHINAMHKKGKLPILPCDQCGAIFHFKAQLRSHKASHV